MEIAVEEGIVVRIVRLRGIMWLVSAIRVLFWKVVGGGVARRWDVQ